MRLRSSLVGEMRFAAQVGGENREREEESISEIDVIAPTKILQQILKAPHSKSRVSVAVQRAGHTVVLNPGPDVAESERLIGKRSLGVSFQNYAGLSPVSQQVPTLSWLEAWLDNVMDSVPELAICNHLNGVVQGYELLPDGISGDAPAVDPNVVQQNSLAVLRFLQSNCKKDPGVYWLYKSASEEDLLQLFDLSTIAKNHSSSASSFPLVVRACAHEQFARFILNNEEEFDLTVEANNVRRKVKVADFDRVEESLDRVVNSASGTIGPVCQDRAPLTATSSISSHRAAVQHVILAIKSLTGTRQLMSSDQEVKWLPTSTLDRKLWSLVLLLGESYLSLGEAYKEDGQLLEALNIVELACSIFGSMPHKFGESLFASAMYTSFSRLIQFGKFEELLNHPTPSTTQDYISFREFPSVRIFWAKVWLMVGEIHVKFQISPLPEGYEVTKKEEMPFEILEEVDKLKNKLTAHSRRCQFCLLVNCTCVAQKKNWGKGRGGIFKYLTRSCRKKPVGCIRLFPTNSKIIESKRR
ncbi:PREDICTED: uncharacterized protein LOC104756646 [Camelina sativa]|uniref:Uncharacterized protein LOC104756646 n=1 Tax=Camelina sativa TaxID=90675 RepID=A0ABM0WXH7_CAMSA|nr:PREDICTED: uncharacterized protein LOC104756646 [Camelina sativa]